MHLLFKNSSKCNPLNLLNTYCTDIKCHVYYFSVIGFIGMCLNRPNKLLYRSQYLKTAPRVSKIQTDLGATLLGGLPTDLDFSWRSINDLILLYAVYLKPVSDCASFRLLRSSAAIMIYCERLSLFFLVDHDRLFSLANLAITTGHDSFARLAKTAVCVHFKT